MSAHPASPRTVWLTILAACLGFWATVVWAAVTR